jgi:UDP-2-acetamido-2-deoxy-ribo-hexuluronate aminotransferase
MNRLLDINEAVDSCGGRRPWCVPLNIAISKCLSEAGRIWLYSGSAQTLEYVTRRELRRLVIEQGHAMRQTQLLKPMRPWMSRHR